MSDLQLDIADLSRSINRACSEALAVIDDLLDPVVVPVEGEWT